MKEPMLTVVVYWPAAGEAEPRFEVIGNLPEEQVPEVLRHLADHMENDLHE